MLRLTGFGMGAVLLSLVAMDSAGAQPIARETDPYPARPVRIILGNAPGGTVDIIARALAEHLMEQLKQVVVVENRPGAGGSIASEFAAKATPDGYTLYLGGLDSIVYSFLANGRTPLDPVKDFTPVGEVAQNEFLVVVHGSLAVNSIAELVKLAKARPKAILFGSSGNGSTLHILGERFAVAAGIEMLHVPYRQGLLPDLLAGRVHVVFAPAPSLKELIATGRLKVLATVAPRRSAHAPDRQTLIESGFPGFWHVGQLYLYAPAPTPRPILLRLNRDVAKAMEAPAFQRRIASLGDAPGRPLSIDEAVSAISERRAWMDKAFEIAMSATKSDHGRK